MGSQAESVKDRKKPTRHQDDSLCQQVCAVNLEKVAHWRKRLHSLAAVAELFKALADETRAKILYLLANEELCVCDLATILGTTVSNVSHHLRLLRAHHLVKYRREGKVAFYSLDDDHVLNLIKEAFDHAQHLNQGTGSPLPEPERSAELDAGQRLKTAR